MTMLGSTSVLGRSVRALKGWLSPERIAARAPARAMHVIGHRGAAKHAPENTIESFEKAIDLGANAIEADVCVTRDGELVLWHDCDPDHGVAIARQGGAEGLLYCPDVPVVGSALRCPVPRLAYEEFRRHHGYSLRADAIEAAARLGSRPSVPTARLHDLLIWAAGEPRCAAIYLDLKLGVEQAAGVRLLLEKLAGACEREPRLGRITFALMSPRLEVCEALRDEGKRLARRVSLPNLRLTCDFELPGVLAGARRLGMRDVSVGYTARRAWADVRDELVRASRARHAGELDSMTVWTVNDRHKLEVLLALGVDGIVTDEPSLLRELWRIARRAERARLPRPRSAGREVVASPAR